MNMCQDWFPVGVLGFGIGWFLRGVLARSARKREPMREPTEEEITAAVRRQFDRALQRMEETQKQQDAEANPEGRLMQ